MVIKIKYKFILNFKNIRKVFWGIELIDVF